MNFLLLHYGNLTAIYIKIPLKFVLVNNNNSIYINNEIVNFYLYPQYRFSFEEEDYIEFSKVSQDKLIGTKGEAATVS